VSLDDATPTEYFGADAQVWDSPDGRSLQLTPAQGQRAAAFGWWLNTDKCPIIFGAEVEHRSGCASTRGRDCTCGYLNQWKAS
jgi:hypothetical protein